MRVVFDSQEADVVTQDVYCVVVDTLVMWMVLFFFFFFFLQKMSYEF